MDKVATRTFDGEVDETRPFEHGRVDVVHLVTTKVARDSFEPGWRWSTSVKPIVGTESCQAHHIGYALAGTLHVVAEDGGEIDITAGQLFEILPGHDAWVVGDETFNGLEFDPESAERYASR